MATQAASEPDAHHIPDYAQLMQLDDQVFVVMGGGFGIGEQAAHALAAFGAKVVCADLDEDRARRVADAVGGRAWGGDLTDRSAVETLFHFVASEFGRLDGVLDIIGLARIRSVVDLTDEDWQFQHEIVLRHAYLAIQCATRLWRSLGTAGSLTFVASTAGLLSAPMNSAYGANKAALMSLVRSAAVELGPEGIRVNAVAPGPTRTPRGQAKDPWGSPLIEGNLARTPLRKLGYPPDVAGALLFFASPLARHVTGQTLAVDGGASVVFNVEVRAPIGP